MFGKAKKRRFISSPLLFILFQARRKPVGRRGKAERVRHRRVLVDGVERGEPLGGVGLRRDAQEVLRDRVLRPKKNRPLASNSS